MIITLEVPSKNWEERIFSNFVTSLRTQERIYTLYIHMEYQTLKSRKGITLFLTVAVLVGTLRVNYCIFA